MVKTSSFLVRALLAALSLSAGGAAFAQSRPVAVVVVPPFAFTENRQTEAGDIGLIAQQVAELVAADLRTTSELVPLGPQDQPRYVYAEVTAPRFSLWRKAGAKAVVTGFATVRSDGRITIGCYVYDVAQGRELGRRGFVVPAQEWRRAAHRCSDTAYAALTGRPGRFDTRVAYVAESGTAMAPVKRIAIMDSDGSNHRFVTPGAATVLTPRLSPEGDVLAFVSFNGGYPHIRVLDIDNEQERPLLPEPVANFAPRFSPDSDRIVFSMSRGGNTDIYVVDARGGMPMRLTTSPGIDTSPSFSPDGRRIVFESDRGGSQQLYVMNADGSDQHRISFGAARYAAPVWSSDGELIAFTRIAGDGMRIGVISASGSDERIVTNGPQDEAPSWGANGRTLLFQRWNPNAGRTGLFMVSADGGDVRSAPTPQGGSDPDWSMGASQ